MATSAPWAAGATSRTIYFRIVTVATGLPWYAGAYNTTGFSLKYTRSGGAPVTMTLVTQTPSGAWTSGGFCHVADGLYRLDVPNAALVAGVDQCMFSGGISTDDQFVEHFIIDLTGSDPRGAISSDVNVVSIAANAVNASAVAADAVTEIVAAFFAYTMEANVTLLGHLRAIAAMTYGRTSGALTNTEIFKGVRNDGTPGKNRVTISNDTQNRTGVTLDLTNDP